MKEMKSNLSLLSLLISVSLISVCLSCKKETIIVLPEVSTSPLTDLTSVTAVCGGNVTSDGGAMIISRGVCWGTAIHPLVSGNSTADEGGTGIFSSSLTGLSGGTEYFVRAYATNSAGTSYGNEYHFITPVTDADGNVYKTIIIGSQVWMAENLMTTKYSDGTSIPNITDNNNWVNIITPGFSWYKNNRISFGKVYGALYNWYAVNTGKLCPAGWHVPSEDEWTVLAGYLGGNYYAGGELKEQGLGHWTTPNYGASNNYGFTALPGGFRRGLAPDPGSSRAMGYLGRWWVSTETANPWWEYGDPVLRWARCLTIFFDSAETIPGMGLKTNGYSIRCVKD
jgi:uncharacterized protein (TIGR02145 family)